MASFMQEFEYSNITGATTTQVFTGKGILHSIIFNTTAAGTTIIADSTTTTTPTVGTIAASPVIGQPFIYDVKIANGLRIITAASPDVTITWTKG